MVGPPDATAGLVVAHGASQTLCDWLDVASTLARRAGVRVLVVDRRGAGSSAAGGTAADYPRDLVAGARWLHEAGQRRLAALGSSAGAPVALAAAGPTGFADAATPPPTGPASWPGTPCAVVLVSPAPSVTAGGGALVLSAVRRLGAPLWTVYEGGTDTFADAAESLARRFPADAVRGRQVRLDATTDHSIGLVEKHPEALDLLVAAAQSCA